MTLRLNRAEVMTWSVESRRGKALPALVSLWRFSAASDQITPRIHTHLLHRKYIGTTAMPSGISVFLQLSADMVADIKGFEVPGSFDQLSCTFIGLLVLFYFLLDNQPVTLTLLLLIASYFYLFFTYFYIGYFYTLIPYLVLLLLCCVAVEVPSQIIVLLCTFKM